MTTEIVPALTPLMVDVNGARALLGGVDADAVRALIRAGELTAITIPTKPGVEGRKYPTTRTGRPDPLLKSIAVATGSASRAYALRLIARLPGFVAAASTSDGQ